MLAWGSASLLTEMGQDASHLSPHPPPQGWPADSSHQALVASPGPTW